MTLRPLPSVLVKKAEKEINEKPQRVASDIVAVRAWLSKQSHLETIKPTDQWLVGFLRGSKFSLERCKEKLELYYTYKTVVPEFFSNRDPYGDRLQAILKLGVFLPLKKLSKVDSTRICIMRMGVFDPSKYHLSDLIKMALMVTEILLLEDDNFTVAGEEVIVDMDNVGINVLSQWTPALAKKIMSCFQKVLPIRMRGTHMINMTGAFEAAYAILKSFLGDKLKKRLKVYKKTSNALYKNIPKEILPVEYGGSEGNLQELTDYWKAKVESYREWFLQQEDARSDESKRSDGVIKNSSVVFGIEGSFRKLELD